MKKNVKKQDQIQTAFREQLTSFCKEFLHLEVEHTYNIMIMRLVTRRVDGKKFNKLQHKMIGAFCRGWEGRDSLQV